MMKISAIGCLYPSRLTLELSGGEAVRLDELLGLEPRRLKMFELTEEQKTSIATWAASHDCEIDNVGAIGGKITYCFTPTSVGTAEKALCACGKELDVTDYACW